MIDTLAVLNDTVTATLAVMTPADTLSAKQVALIVNNVLDNVKVVNPVLNYVLSALALAGTAISVRCWYIIKKHKLKK